MDGHLEEIPCSRYDLYCQAGTLRQTDETFLRNLADALLPHDAGERGSVICEFNSNATREFDTWSGMLATDQPAVAQTNLT